MAQERSRARDKKRTAAGQTRRRTCRLCNQRIEDVDWKDLTVLRRFMSEKGKIRPQRVTDSCRRHHVQIGVAVKRARVMALLPYATR